MGGGGGWISLVVGIMELVMNCKEHGLLYTTNHETLHQKLKRKSNINLS